MTSAVYDDAAEYLAGQLYRYYMIGFAREGMAYEAFRQEARHLGLQFLAVNNEAKSNLTRMPPIPPEVRAQVEREWDDGSVLSPTEGTQDVEN